MIMMKRYKRLYWFLLFIDVFFTGVWSSMRQDLVRIDPRDQFLEAVFPTRISAKSILPADWSERLNAELRAMNAALSEVEWRLTTSPTPKVARAARRLGARRTQWRNRWCDILAASGVQDRQVQLLCRGPRYTTQQASELSSLLGELQDIYSSTRVCRRPDACYSGEPDLERLMRESRDPAELLWAWSAWRQAVGPPSKPLYERLVQLLNQGAAANGYHDIGECWREELETSHLEIRVEELYREIEPLYVLLHAVVRHRLVQLYGEQTVDPRGPIPAHLLGNMWAQNWESLLDIITSDSSVQRKNLTASLREKNYTVHDMLRRAEDFYTSLRLEPMTPSFWTRSQVKATGRGTCHGSAANMFRRDDYRLLLCAEVNEEDFYVIHHEMGHIEYYMSYRDQPTVYQDGANSAFQEAVGDSVMYGVMVPQHLQRLGLINDSTPTDDLDVSFLLRQALSKIPQLPFALLVDKWRWEVFRGAVLPPDYNRLWWEYRERYQGVAPPVPREETDFDPASKFHIPDNTPYVRYFLSAILQVQMFKGMCEAAVIGHVGIGDIPLPLHRCDIYGSKQAGKRLKSMMSQGSSQPWPLTLAILTGDHDYSVRPLLEYYAPVYRWLKRQVMQMNIPVGWH